MVVTNKTLLSLQVNTDSDVVLARRRARQISYLLGFDSHDQTRLSTAVSEIARNALVHAGGGRLEFSLADKQAPFKFIIRLIDKGPGIKDIDQLLRGNSEQLGLYGASRLVDKFSATNLESGGSSIELEKNLVLRYQPFSDAEINQLANSLMKLVATNPMDEVHQQNQELLAALDQLSAQQLQLDRANLETEEKNRNLSEMNQQMQALNNSLERKVEERTSALLEMNAQLSFARDEAVMANELKSQFVANISHEIRTPMSGILSSTELIMDDCANMGEETQELVRMAHESANGLMNIINDLLDFAKLESGKEYLQEREFYLPQLIAEVMESVAISAKKKSLPITAVIAESLKTTAVKGDPAVLKRVMLNLVHNAVKFTANGEVNVTVDIAEQTADDITIKYTVTDTGIGIDEEDKKRLFQPFVQADGSNTRRYGGTGLGLSISNGYVILMGGKIGFESTKDKGSVFWFQVTLKAA